MTRLAECRDVSCRRGAVAAITRDVRAIARTNARIYSVRAAVSVSLPSPPRPVHLFNSGIMSSVRAALAASRAASPPSPPAPHRPFVQRVVESIARAVQVQAPPQPPRRHSAPQSSRRR